MRVDTTCFCGLGLGAIHEPLIDLLPQGELVLLAVEKPPCEDAFFSSSGGFLLLHRAESHLIAEQIWEMAASQLVDPPAPRTRKKMPAQQPKRNTTGCGLDCQLQIGGLGKQ